MSPGGGDGGAGAAQEQEERRKAELRARIDNLYGVPTAGRHQIQEQIPDPSYSPEPGETFIKTIPVTREVPFGDTSAAEEAKRAMEGENTNLANATRGYYTDELGKDYGEAERNTRFRLARQGLIGGSEDVYQQGDVESDRDLGATRVDEAVRRAISNLTSSREQERLNATNLVNAGAGDSAVSAAQAGLRNSFENVASQQKADLFSDLFTKSADVGTANNLNAQQLAILNRSRGLSSFFPNSSTTSGRVTAS